MERVVDLGTETKGLSTLTTIVEKHRKILRTTQLRDSFREYSDLATNP
jgi:hypothetical protein